MQIYPEIFSSDGIPLNQEVSIIIGTEEGTSHQFVHGEDTYNTYPTIISQNPLHQEVSIIIEKEE